MEIETTQNENQLSVVLTGRLDTVTSKELLEKLTIEERKGKDVVFDFKSLDYLSSAGLRALVFFKKEAQQTGNKVEILNANEMVKDIFKTTGFDKILNVK